VAAGDVMTGYVTVLVEEFIVMRRGLGYQMGGPERYLRAFAGFLERAGHHGPIPLAVSVEWATSTSSADPCNHARRLNVVRGFLGYLSALDGATEVPPPGLLSPTSHRRPPHVYSDDEITDLMRAATGLSPRKGLRPCRSVTLFVLFRYRNNTNNVTERAVRPVKVQQRSSGGCWRTLEGLADFAVIESYLSTAGHWGISRFEALYLLFTTGPWIPTSLSPAASAT